MSILKKLFKSRYSFRLLSLITACVIMFSGLAACVKPADDYGSDYGSGCNDNYDDPDDDNNDNYDDPDDDNNDDNDDCGDDNPVYSEGNALEYADEELPQHLIINQIFGLGNNTDGSVSHSFIELYNPTDSDISLLGYSVQFAGNGTDWQN